MSQCTLDLFLGAQNVLRCPETNLKTILIFETFTGYYGVDNEKQKKILKRFLKKSCWRVDKNFENPALDITEVLKFILDIRTFGRTEF